MLRWSVVGVYILLGSECGTCRRGFAAGKNAILPVMYHREGLVDIRVLKLFPAKKKEILFLPNIWTFSHNLKFLRPGLTHRPKNCTGQTSGCVDQLLLQAIDNISYFVSIEYLVENELKTVMLFGPLVLTFYTLKPP